MDANGINKIFRDKARTLGCAESFTGGAFANAITAVSGASHFFKGGFVTYATEEKNRVLGIKYDTLDQYGVVSQEVAGEMASHAKSLLNVDYCVAFTGNAGPEAMEGKPVGEVYIAIAFYDKCQVFAYHLDGDRKTIQNKAINIAFELLEEIISKNS